MEEELRNRPEKVIKVGGVTATIWSNVRDVNGVPTEFKKVIIKRTFLDKDGDFKETNSFGARDLAKARIAIDEALRYLYFGDETPKKEEQQEAEAPF